jgi:hypothetical protein
MSIYDSSNSKNIIDYYSIFSKTNSFILYRNLSLSYTKLL